MTSNRYALIIGNSEYTDKRLSRLNAPKNDAEDFASILENNEIGKFNVTVYIDEPSEIIRLAISKFFSDRQKDDTLLLYFSGHGFLDHRHNRLYLTTKNTDTDHLEASAIPAPFINERMDDSPSKRKLLILDCCHSGAIEINQKGFIGTTVNTENIFKGEGYGRVIITATDAIQNAFQGDQVIGETKYSLFSHYLIDGLKSGTADLDKNGEITTSEIYEYIHQSMLTTKANQSPRRYAFQDGKDILIAWNIAGFQPMMLLNSDLLFSVQNRYPEIRKSSLSLLRDLLFTDEAHKAFDALEHLSKDKIEEIAASAKSIVQEFNQRKVEELLQNVIANKKYTDIVAQADLTIKENLLNTLISELVHNRPSTKGEFEYWLNLLRSNVTFENIETMISPELLDSPEDNVSAKEFGVFKANTSMTYCISCGSSRSVNLFIPCPLCGSRKYPVFGYVYQHEVNSIPFIGRILNSLSNIQVSIKNRNQK